MRQPETDDVDKQLAAWDWHTNHSAPWAGVAAPHRKAAL